MHQILNQEVRVDVVNPCLQEVFQVSITSINITLEMNGLKQNLFYHNI